MAVTRRRVAGLVVLILVAAGATGAQSRQGGIESIQVPALKEWLTYLASDELQGREVYTEGLGLAASYIAERLAEWGLKPAPGETDFFQTVKVVGVRNAGRSSVTVDVGGQRRTFADGEGITLPRNAGARQTVTASRVVFAGYGLEAPSAGLDDYRGLDPAGAAVVLLGTAAPKAAGGSSRVLANRTRLALSKGAVATLAPPSRFARGRGAASGTSSPDFTTAERYDRPVPPAVAAQDEFFEFLFSASPVKYAELKALAEKQEPLPHFTLEGVTLTVDVAPEYSVVTTRLSRNIVAVVEGSDPALKDTYVAFGAHYDHIGYEQTASAAAPAGDSFGCAGQSRRTPRAGDLVNNGADDDGSGTVALMAIARAFALGPRPRRSLLFVWHTAEETGLQGSRYNADFPVVPNEKILAQLNLDMVGRNRCDDPDERHTVYLVGSDRISTDLHNISEAANAALRAPMTLDYELNDPADPQSLYTRSDHYSYANKGIPVIFYTTGLHRDYHAVTDEIDHIEWEKMARITRLVYATGQRLADLDRAPVRDNKGPRVGKGRGGRIQ